MTSKDAALTQALTALRLMERRAQTRYTLAQALQVSDRTALKLLQRLLAQQLITVVAHGGGAGLATTYRAVVRLAPIGGRRRRAA